MQNETENKSFEEFLNSLTWEDLTEHASTHISGDYAIEILMEQEGNYGDYLLNLKNIETDEDPDKLRDQVLAAITELEEEVIIDLLINMVDEETIIRHLIEITDEDSRRDILDNQASWDGKTEKKD